MTPTTTHPSLSIARGPRSALLLFASALAACAAQPDPCPAPVPPAIASPRGDTISFASGSGTSARVTRAVAPDGSETLHGETDLSLGASSRRCIVEDVSLDARGSLVRADVSTAASCDAAPETLAHLDPASGVARVTTPAGGDDAPRLRLAGASSGMSAPWIYTPQVVPGRAVTTPVAAWVAFRAAAVSPSLTLIELELRRAWRVPRDQIVVPTEAGATVVLGDDGADVWGGFVQRLHLADYDVTLVRSPGGAEPAI